MDNLDILVDEEYTLRPENKEIVTIDVSIDGKGQLYRDYVFTDGQAPEGIEDSIQDMVDTIISSKKNWKDEKSV